jgi:hypothetical protein
LEELTDAVQAMSKLYTMVQSTTKFSKKP